MVKITIKIPKKDLDKSWGFLDSINQSIEPDTLGDRIVSQLLTKIREAEINNG